MKFKLLSLILTLVLIEPCFSQCIGDCVNGAGKKGYHCGEYVGFFKNSMKEGQGKFTFSNGEIYEGEWRNDRPTTGKYTWKTGEFWVGGVWLKLNYEKFKSNVAPKGSGTLTLPNGEKFRLTYTSQKYSSFLLNGNFNWYYPNSCYKLSNNNIWVNGEFKSDGGFISRVELDRQNMIVQAQKAEAKYKREVESLKLAQQRVNLSLNYLPIEVNELIINSHKIGLVTTNGNHNTGGFVDFSSYSRKLKINNKDIPGFVIKNDVKYYNLSAIKAMSSQLRLKKWQVISLFKYQEYCDEPNKIGKNCFWCGGEKYVTGILSYNTCNACNYFTKEQRKFNPCSVCRNTQMVNVKKGRKKCTYCNGKGKEYADYSFWEILAKQLKLSSSLSIWCLNGDSSYSIADIFKDDKCEEVDSQLNEYMFFPLFVKKE